MNANSTNASSSSQLSTSTSSAPVKRRGMSTTTVTKVVTSSSISMASSSSSSLASVNPRASFSRAEPTTTSNAGPSTGYGAFVNPYCKPSSVLPSSSSNTSNNGSSTVVGNILTATTVSSSSSNSASIVRSSSIELSMTPDILSDITTATIATSNATPVIVLPVIETKRTSSESVPTPIISPQSPFIAMKSTASSFDFSTMSEVSQQHTELLSSSSSNYLQVEGRKTILADQAHELKATDMTITHKDTDFDLNSELTPTSVNMTPMGNISQAPSPTETSTSSNGPSSAKSNGYKAKSPPSLVIAAEDFFNVPPPLSVHLEREYKPFANDQSISESLAAEHVEKIEVVAVDNHGADDDGDYEHDSRYQNTFLHVSQPIYEENESNTSISLEQNHDNIKHEDSSHPDYYHDQQQRQQLDQFQQNPSFSQPLFASQHLADISTDSSHALAYTPSPASSIGVGISQSKTFFSSDYLPLSPQQPHPFNQETFQQSPLGGHNPNANRILDNPYNISSDSESDDDGGARAKIRSRDHQAHETDSNGFGDYGKATAIHNVPLSLENDNSAVPLMENLYPPFTQSRPRLEMQQVLASHEYTQNGVRNDDMHGYYGTKQQPEHLQTSDDYQYSQNDNGNNNHEQLYYSQYEDNQHYEAVEQSEYTQADSNNQYWDEYQGAYVQEQQQGSDYYYSDQTNSYPVYTDSQENYYYDEQGQQQQGQGEQQRGQDYYYDDYSYQYQQQGEYASTTYAQSQQLQQDAQYDGYYNEEHPYSATENYHEQDYSQQQHQHSTYQDNNTANYNDHYVAENYDQYGSGSHEYAESSSQYNANDQQSYYSQSQSASTYHHDQYNDPQYQQQYAQYPDERGGYGDGYGYGNDQQNHNDGSQFKEQNPMFASHRLQSQSQAQSEQSIKKTRSSEGSETSNNTNNKAKFYNPLQKPQQSQSSQNQTTASMTASSPSSVSSQEDVPSSTATAAQETTASPGYVSEEDKKRRHLQVWEKFFENAIASRLGVGGGEGEEDDVGSVQSAGGSGGSRIASLKDLVLSAATNISTPVIPTTRQAITFHSNEAKKYFVVPPFYSTQLMSSSRSLSSLQSGIDLLRETSFPSMISPKRYQLLVAYAKALGNSHELKENNISYLGLFASIISNDFSTFQYFISLGLNINASDEVGRTIAYYCVFYHVDLDFLSLCNDNNMNFDHVDAQGNSLLHFAVFHGKTEVIDFLLQCAIDWKIKNREGLTALDVARQIHRRKVVHLLEIAEDLPLTEYTEDDPPETQSPERKRNSKDKEKEKEKEKERLKNSDSTSGKDKSRNKNSSSTDRVIKSKDSSDVTGKEIGSKPSLSTLNETIDDISTSKPPKPPSVSVPSSGSSVMNADIMTSVPSSSIDGTAKVPRSKSALNEVMQVRDSLLASTGNSSSGKKKASDKHRKKGDNNEDEEEVSDLGSDTEDHLDDIEGEDGSTSRNNVYDRLAGYVWTFIISMLNLTLAFLTNKSSNAQHRIQGSPSKGKRNSTESNNNDAGKGSNAKNIPPPPNDGKRIRGVSTDYSDSDTDANWTNRSAPPTDAELNQQGLGAKLSPPRDVQLAIAMSRAGMSFTSSSEGPPMPPALPPLHPPPPISTAHLAVTIPKSNSTDQDDSESQASSSPATPVTAMNTPNPNGSNNYSIGRNLPPGVSWRYVNILDDVNK